jgi:hypothetical protein
MDAAEAAWTRASRRVFALLNEAKLGGKDNREARLRLYRWFFQDECIGSTNDLNTDALRSFADTLDYWKREGRLETEARRYSAPVEY